MESTNCEARQFTKDSEP